MTYSIILDHRALVDIQEAIDYKTLRERVLEQGLKTFLINILIN